MSRPNLRGLRAERVCDEFGVLYVFKISLFRYGHIIDVQAFTLNDARVSVPVLILHARASHEMGVQESKQDRTRMEHFQKNLLGSLLHVKKMIRNV